MITKLKATVSGITGTKNPVINLFLASLIIFFLIGFLCMLHQIAFNTQVINNANF